VNQIVVTFYWQEEVNNKISVEIRGKLEGLSDKWVQVFPNQVAIQTEYSAQEVYESLLPLSKAIRVSVFQFSDHFINDTFITRRLDERGYSLPSTV